MRTKFDIYVFIIIVDLNNLITVIGSLTGTLLVPVVVALVRKYIYNKGEEKGMCWSLWWVKHMYVICHISIYAWEKTRKAIKNGISSDTGNIGQKTQNEDKT